MLTLELPPELEALLADMAEATGKPINRIAIEAILERVEDWEDLAIAEQRMREFDGEGIPFEDVLREIEALEAKERSEKPAAE